MGILDQWKTSAATATPKGAAAFALAFFLAVSSAAQEPPHPRAALLQCLMTASDPGERVDRICAGLAMDVCGVGRSDEIALTCRAELACRFVEEAALLETRRGAGLNYNAWRAADAECRAQTDGVAECRYDLAMAHWIDARQNARNAGIALEVGTGEVARCWLD